MMVPESPLESTEHGLVPTGKGWFVLNAREAPWIDRKGRGFRSEFEGIEDKADFSQLGINLRVLGPGEPMAMYHWEADQEDFLVLAGEALLIVEGEERPLRQWDLVHCPAGTKHVIVGAGDTPCVLLAVGARGRSTGPDWGGYTVDESALRHGAGVEQETTDAEQAYARFPQGKTDAVPRGLAPQVETCGLMELLRGPTVTLRPAAEDDLDLLTRWFSDPAVYEWWGGSPLRRDVVAEKYIGRRRPAVESLIIEAEGKPVGYVQHHQGFHAYHGADEGGIDMFVAPDTRRRGFGRDAAETLVRHLLSEGGWSRVTVDPAKNNPRALRFWRECGFQYERDVDSKGPAELLSVRAADRRSSTDPTVAGLSRTDQ